MKPESFLPLRSVELDILLGIADSPRHGYAILKDAEERTGGSPGFEIPTLYRALRRMRGQGLVRALKQHGEGEDARRQYWQATELGQRVLALEVERLETLVAAGRARVDAARAKRA
jgi:DNA-binding PadR family transcriptional regulator